MSPTRQVRRLHRSFAAAEARYVRDLGRRERSSSRAARPAVGRGYRGPTERLDVEYRRVRAGR